MDKYHVQSKKEGRIAGSEQSGEEGKVFRQGRFRCVQLSDIVSPCIYKHFLSKGACEADFCCHEVGLHLIVFS